ncbi:MAG: S8 family serine peptidase, partial [Bacteroidota bacterium]
AQPHYTFHLVSGTLPATENLESFIGGDAVAAGELMNGHYVRLVQFYNTPDAQMRSVMQAAGLQFLAYVPQRAYLVAIPATFDRARLRNFDVRGVHRLTAQHKLRQSLKDRPLPASATLFTGFADLDLSCYPILNAAQIQDRLQALGAEILSPSHVGAITIRVPEAQIENVATWPFVSFVDPRMPEAEPENYTGRTLHRSNAIASDHPMGRKYDGTGVVVAMGDDGIIGPHIDYQGRADQSSAGASSGNHGDHVAGTIFGAGNLNPANKGMAFGADLKVYDVWDAVNSAGLHNGTFGVMVTSTSYGNGCNAGYTGFTQTADQMTRLNPTLLHVFSAGNSGTSACGYGNLSNWGNVTGGIKVGKNVLAVAALDANGNVANFSSRGPAHDGRIKPDISAKGSNVTSTVEGNAYQSLSGTSMACPGISGITAQLIHAYRDLNGQQDPPSALTKAVLLNSANDIGNPGPDYTHGFGHVNALRAVMTLENGTYMEDSVDQNGLNTHMINVPAGTALMKVMVYWHDYEAVVNASTALVNNIDMRVTDPGAANTYDPWVLDETPTNAAVSANATRGIDDLNNVEQFTLEAPTPGNYTINIDGKNIPFGPQKYYLVYEFRDSATTVTYPMGGESFNPGDPEKIRWDAVGNSGAWTIEYTTNNGSTWLLATSGLNGSRRRYDFNVPTGFQSGEARFRVTRNGVSAESAHNMSIMSVPNNLNAFRSCPTTIELRWDSLATATSYDVYMLGNKYMDSIGTTSNARFTVTGTDANTTYWFAIRAEGPDGAFSRRTIAIEKGPGLWNCADPNDVGVSDVTAPGNGVFMTCTGNTDLPVKVVLQSHSPNPISNVSVNYQLNSGAVVNEIFTGTIPAYDTVSFTFSASVDLSATGNHVLHSWTSFPADPYNVNDSTSMNIQVMDGGLASLPYTEDFESFQPCSQNAPCAIANCAVTNDWAQSLNNFTDDIDWRIDAAGTPTQSTGPSMDHNPGIISGKYLYTESTNCYEQRAMLYTPCIDLTGLSAPQLSFWYNMNGTTMGRLHVDVFVDGRWQADATPSISWNWGDNWRNRIVDLSPWIGETVSLRFRGVTGPSFASDMAIDDINISDGAVSITDQKDLPVLNVYPNPGDGIFNYAIEELNAENIRLTVTDLAGRVVKVEEISNFVIALKGQLNLSSESTGIYFLKVEADGQTYGAKISLQR